MFSCGLWTKWTIKKTIKEASTWHWILIIFCLPVLRVGQSLCTSWNVIELFFPWWTTSVPKFGVYLFPLKIWVSKWMGNPHLVTLCHYIISEHKWKQLNSDSLNSDSIKVSMLQKRLGLTTEIWKREGYIDLRSNLIDLYLPAKSGLLSVVTFAFWELWRLARVISFHILTN